MLKTIFCINFNAIVMAVILIFVHLKSGIAATPSSQFYLEFMHQQVHYSVTGEKIGSTTYLYNKGAGKKISVTTLDWKPYIGKSMCRQGWVQQLTIALLVSRGYEVKSTFLPWARSVAVVETGKADILYPEYFIEPAAASDSVKGALRLDHLALSRKIPGGPIAFIKRKGEPDNYKGEFKNLKNEKIGVVRGYQNTPEFDALMDSGFFDISHAVDDFMNVKKLYNRRINLIIGDPAVIFYSIRNSTSDVEQKQMLRSIEVVNPVIQYNYLYYAVSKKRPGWQTILDDLNRAIQDFEKTGLMFEIIRQTTDACGIHMDPVFLPDSIQDQP